MLIKFGYIMLGAMVLLLLLALCVEVRDTWQDIREELKLWRRK